MAQIDDVPRLLLGHALIDQLLLELLGCRELGLRLVELLSHRVVRRQLDVEPLRFGFQNVAPDQIGEKPLLELASALLRVDPLLLQQRAFGLLELLDRPGQLRFRDLLASHHCCRGLQKIRAAHREKGDEHQQDQCRSLHAAEVNC